VSTTLTSDDNTDTCQMSTCSVWNLEHNHITSDLAGRGRRSQGLKKFGTAVVLPFPPPLSLPSPLLPSPPFPSFSIPLEVGPSNPARGSAPQRGLGRTPSRNRLLMHFSPKIRHLVVKILMIFLRINLPNFMYFEVYQTWTGGDGNCFLSGPIILEVMQNN